MERERYQKGEPLDPGALWMVLTDDAFVEDRFGLRRVTGKPVKDPANPVLRDAGALPTVLFDPIQICFHMWTHGHDREAWEHQFKIRDFDAKKHFYPYVVRYARSLDGRNWEMPDLGLVPDPRGRWKNIVLTGDWRAQALCVWFNPDESDTQRRFLMTYKDRPGGGSPALVLASSPDGVHIRTEREVLWHCSDGAHQSVYDEERKRWLLYTRPSNRALVPQGPYEGFNHKRRLAVHVGPTPWQWGYGRACLLPEEEVDVPDIDFVHVFKHGTHFIAFLTMMDMSREGVTEVYLATSRDGLNWTRFPHRPVFLPRGPEGSWDAGQAHNPYMAGVYDGSVRIYYTGTPDGQKAPRSRPGGIGMADLPEGRWTGLQAGEQGGYLLTRELKVTGSRLEVNFEPQCESGFARVRLLQRDPSAEPDKRAQSVNGFDFADCSPVRNNTTQQAVEWTERNDLSELKGQSVYVHVHLCNGTLFGLRFSP